MQLFDLTGVDLCVIVDLGSFYINIAYIKPLFCEDNIVTKRPKTIVNNSHSKDSIINLLQN